MIKDTAKRKTVKFYFAKTFLVFFGFCYILFLYASQMYWYLIILAFEVLYSRTQQQFYSTVCVAKDSSGIYRLDIVCTTQLSVFSYSGFFFKITKPSIIGASEISV